VIVKETFSTRAIGTGQDVVKLSRELQSETQPRTLRRDGFGNFGGLGP
jgi:hypothetical protein